MKFNFLFILICLSGWGSFAQRCALISIDHFGGPGSEVLVEPYLVNHSDGSFSLAINSTSTSGSISTGCSAQDQRRHLRTYTADYSGLLGSACAPTATALSRPTFFYFPQNNGDTIFIGSKTMPGGGDNVGIERRNAAGTILWSKDYGGTGHESPGLVLQTADSGYYVCSMVNAADGDVGMHYGSVFDFDIWIIKLSNDGNLLWSKVLGGTLTDMQRDMKLAPDGGCYLFATTASTDFDATGNHGGSNLLIIKMDSLGNKQWHKCLGGSGNDGSGYDLSIAAVSDNHGGFYVVNYTSSHDGDVQRRMPDSVDLWLVHMDSVGNIIWENTYGGPGWQVAGAICLAADNTIWMGGSLADGSSVGGHISEAYRWTDGWVVHVDTLGNFINQRTLGANREQSVRALKPLADGSVLAIGMYEDNSFEDSMPFSEGFSMLSEGLQDIFIARLGPQSVGIDAVDGATSWNIYPNPASTQLTLTLEAMAPGHRMRVTDVSGKTISTFAASPVQTLSVAEWAAGMYWFELRDADGQVVGVKTVMVK